MRKLQLVIVVLCAMMVMNHPHQCTVLGQTFYGETFTTAKNVAGLTTSSTTLYLINDDEEVKSIPLDRSTTSLQSVTEDLDSAASILHLPVASVLLIAESKGIQRYTFSTTTLTKIAGGNSANSVDGTGSAARMNSPAGLVAKADESVVYFVDTARCNVRSMTYPGMVVTTLAGGTCGFADATGTSAQFQSPTAMALGASETSLIVADGGNNRLRSVALSGYAVTTLACSGTAGSVDGTALSATCNNPSGVVRIPSSGVIYFVDQGTSVLRRLSGGTVTTVLGTAGTTGTTNGFGSAGLLNTPLSIAVDASGYLYIGQSGSNARVVRVTVADTTPSPTTTTAAPVTTTTSTAAPTTTTTAAPTTSTSAPTTSTGAPSTSSPTATTTAAPSTTTPSPTTTTAAPVTTTTSTEASTVAPTTSTVIPSTAGPSTSEAPTSTGTPSSSTSTTTVPATSPPPMTTVSSTTGSPTDTPATTQAESTTAVTTKTQETDAPTQTSAPATNVVVPASTAVPDTSAQASTVESPATTVEPSTLPLTTTTEPSTTLKSLETTEPLPPVATDANGADATPAVVGSLALKINVETARARASELQAAIAEAAQVTTEAVTILAIVPGSAVVHFQIRTQRDAATVTQNMSTSVQSGGALAAFAPVLETLTLQRKPGDALFAVGVTLYVCIGLAIVALGASIGWSLYRRRNPDVVMKVKPTAALRAGTIYIDVKPDGDADESSEEVGAEEDEEKVELMRVGPKTLSKKSIRVIKSKEAQERSYLGLKATEGFVVDLDAQIELRESLSDDDGVSVGGKKCSPKAQDAGQTQIVNGGLLRRNGSRRRFQGFSASNLPELPPLAPLPPPRLNGFEMLQRLQPSREVIDGDLAAGYAMK